MLEVLGKLMTINIKQFSAENNFRREILKKKKYRKHYVLITIKY